MKKKLLIIISALLVIAYLARVIYINANNRFEHTQVSNYEMGETCQMDDFTYTVKAFDIYTMYEMQEKFDIELDEAKDKETLFMVATVDVEYNGEEKDMNHFVKGYFVMESGAWRNGIVFRTLNSMTPFTKGEKRTMYVYATNAEIKIGSSNWEDKAKDMEYTITSICYPKEVRLKCY